MQPFKSRTKYNRNYFSIACLVETLGRLRRVLYDFHYCHKETEAAVKIQKWSRLQILWCWKRCNRQQIDVSLSRHWWHEWHFQRWFLWSTRKSPGFGFGLRDAKSCAAAHSHMVPLPYPWWGHITSLLCSPSLHSELSCFLHLAPLEIITSLERLGTVKEIKSQS